MMKIILPFSRFLVLAFSFSIFSQPVLFAITINELQAKMVESDAALKSVQFDYVQEMRSSQTTEVQVSSGMAVFMKPKRMRVEQKEPEQQLIVSSGKYIFIYTPRFSQVIKDSWKRWSAKNILFPGLLGFSDTLQKMKKDYLWEIVGHSDVNGVGTFAVRLKGAFHGDKEYLDIWVGETDFIPRKTELVSGTLKVTTTLSSMKLNPDLNAELFNFKKPARAEVIQIP